jgi:hypothetical protein
LKVAVDELETIVVTPIMSGDIAIWITALQQTWKEAAAQIHYEAKHERPRQYEEIANQDPELLPRIEILRSEDAAIEEERERLNHAVSRIADHTAQLEPDEERAARLIARVAEELTAFIARVRKQNVVVQTWYVEAFSRDHGAVD